MFILKSIESVELKENFLVINGKELNFGALTEDDKEVLNTMISKGSKYLPLLYLNSKYVLESVNGKKLNKIEYLSYLLECKKFKKVGVRESDTHIRPLTNVENLEILEGDNSIYFGKEGKLYKETLTEGRLWGEYEDAEDIEREKKIAKEMGEYADNLVKAFKDAGWAYDDSSAKYGHYKFSKDGVNAEYCDNFDKMGSADIESEVLKDLTEDERERFDFEPYNVGDDYAFIDFKWRHPSPEKVVRFVEYAMSKSLNEGANPDRAAVDDPALNAEEEEELNSLYDREIKEYRCKKCGKVIPNIHDWDKKHYKEYGNEYYCPYCGEPYTYDEVKDMAIFKETTDIEEPKEGFIVFQSGGMLGDSHDLEDKVFKTKEEAKAALKLWKDSYGRNKSYYKPEGSIYKYRGKTAKETREEFAKRSDLKEGAYPNFDLPEGYPQEVYDKYFEYTKDIDLTEDEPLDFNEWYKSNGGDIKEVSPEELNAFLEAWENGDRESLDGQKLICFNGNEIIAIDNSDGYARIETFDRKDEGYARGWLNGKVDYEEFKLLKKRVNESVEENFRDMVMELHGYVEADPKRISSDLQDAIKNNKLDDYLKNKAAMSDEEVNDFKERYLKESTVEEPRALVLDSYNHFMKDLGKTPTVDDIEEDILHAYSNAEEFFKGNESPEEYLRDLKYIQWVLRTENLDYAEDLEEGAGTQVGDIAPEEDYIKPMVKVDTKKRKKRIVKESAETYTDEEKAEYGLDDEGYDKNGDLWIHCAWCGELVPVSECKKELNMGWICDSCQKALYSRGEKAHYEEGANYLEESIKEDVANINDIEYVEPNYTGGGVYVYTGKLKDGNYFLGGDDWFDENNKMFTIRIVNENPDDYEEDCWFDDWQQEHLVRDLTEEENKEITKQILHWIIENKPDGNYDIRNMEDMLDIVEPKKIEEAVEKTLADRPIKDLTGEEFLKMLEEKYPNGFYVETNAGCAEYRPGEGLIDTSTLGDEEAVYPFKTMGDLIDYFLLDAEETFGEESFNDILSYDGEFGMPSFRSLDNLNEASIPQGSEEACAYIFRKYRDEYDSINEVRWDQDRINELFDEGGMEKVNDEFFLPAASSTYKRDYKLLLYPQNIEKYEKEKEIKKKEREEKEKNRKPRKTFTIGDIVDRLNKDLNKNNIGAYPPSGQGDNTIKVRKIDERFGLRFYVQMTYEEIPYDSFAISFNNVLSKKFADKVQPIIDLNRGTYTRRLGSERVFPEDFVFYIYKYDDIDKLAEVMKQILDEPTKVEESLKVGDKISFYSNGYKTNGKWSNKRDIKMNTEVTNVLPNGAVSAKDPQGAKGFDYISPGEIAEVNGELSPKLEYFAKVYYAHDNGDHDHKWNKKEIKDWVKDEIEMGNDMFDLDSDTLNMLYQFQHELYQEDKEEGLV